MHVIGKRNNHYKKIRLVLADKFKFQLQLCIMNLFFTDRLRVSSKHSCMPKYLRHIETISGFQDKEQTKISILLSLDKRQS